MTPILCENLQNHHTQENLMCQGTQVLWFAPELLHNTTGLLAERKREMVG